MEFISMVLDILNTCNEGFWVLCLADKLMERRELVRTVWYKQAAAVLLGYVLVVIGMNQWELSSPYTVLAAIAYVLLSSMWLWNTNILVKTAIVSAYYMLLLLVSLLEISIVGWIGGEALILLAAQQHGFARVMFILICGLMWFGINWGINKIISKQIVIDSQNYIIFISVIGLIGSVYLVNQFLREFQYQTNVLTYVFLILFLVTVYGGYILYKYKAMLRQQQMTMLREEYMEEQYQRLNAHYIECQQIYHDLNAHFRTIYEMALRNETAEIVRYVKSIQASIQPVQIQSWTGLDIADIIFSEYMKLANENSIEMSINADILPLNLPLENREICSLFSNLLKNCMEANPTKVEVTVKLVGQMLMIATENDYKVQPKKVGRQYLTTKKDKTKHGMGLVIIETIVNKYDGMVSYREEEGIFRVNLTLNMLRDE